MAVGFGDAGAEIIADNMRSGGDLNPMVPGQKVTAIFGFCDVRQFTDTTEILQVPPQPRFTGRLTSRSHAAASVRLAQSACPRRAQHLASGMASYTRRYMQTHDLLCGRPR